MSTKLIGSDPHYRETLDGKYRLVKVGLNGEARYEVWEKNGAKQWALKRALMGQQESYDYLMSLQADL